MVGTGRLKELIAEANRLARFPEGAQSVALSGGADSAALGLLALESGSDVVAIHIDHGLPGSPQMREAATAVAAQLEIPLTVESVSLDSGASPEARARDARYSVLTVLETSVLTGHTADDNAETIVINLVRGTALSGLTGIPYHRPPNVYRPILQIGGSQTREIATLAGLSFVDDPMNRDMTLARNRIRHRLLPVMRELNPRVERTLNEMGGRLAGDAETMESLTPGSESNTLASSIPMTMPTGLADRLIINWLRANGVAVSAGIVSRVWSVLRGESESQELEDGLRIRRERAVVKLERVG